MSRPPRTKAMLDPTVPFTRADARAAGLPLTELRGPKFQKVFYDLYVGASVEVTATIRAVAALRICAADAYASHHTAAEIWGGCVPDGPDTHVSVRGSNRSERRGIRAHESTKGCNTTVFRGIPISTPEQTFLDLAATLSIVELVVLGDSLVRAGRTTPDALIEAAATGRGRGVRLARRAAKFVRAGVDSPMESRLRMLIVLAGLPEPVVNLVIRDRDGNWVMRFDLSYPEFKLIIEYDGRQHAEDDAQWGRDLDRRELLDGLGWRLLVVRSGGIYREADVTLRRIRDALRERGARDLPGKFRSEWRQHFPVRRAPLR